MTPTTIDRAASIGGSAERRNITFAEYLDLPHYGSSDLRTFKIGPPANVPWRRANRTETDATRLGSAAHCAILTPELFQSIYAVKPEGMTFASREGKAWRDAHDGFVILTHDESVAIAGIVDAFDDKRAACGNWPMDHVEQSITWRCKDSGLPCKARPDWFDATAIYDLKVSRVADKPTFLHGFAAHANGWLNQLAHGRAGLAECGINVRLGRIVMVSPTAPHRVHLIEVRESDMDFLELDNTNTRRGMVVCHESGLWPGTPDTWTTIELPASAAFTETDLEGAEEIPL